MDAEGRLQTLRRLQQKQEQKIWALPRRFLRPVSRERVEDGVAGPPTVLFALDTIAVAVVRVVGHYDYVLGKVVVVAVVRLSED